MDRRRSLSGPGGRLVALALWGALLGYAFGAGPAGAQSAEGLTEADARRAHAEADINDDGMVDREEFYRRMVDVFYLNDVDKNGYLDRDELAAMQEGMVYEPADQNDDGRLTLAEYVDQRFEAFHAADTDSSGLISVDEVIDVYTAP